MLLTQPQLDAICGRVKPSGDCRSVLRHVIIAPNTKPAKQLKENFKDIENAAIWRT
jgi:hypothetical protein